MSRSLVRVFGCTTLLACGAAESFAQKPAQLQPAVAPAPAPSAIATVAPSAAPSAQSYEQMRLREPVQPLHSYPFTEIANLQLQIQAMEPPKHTSFVNGAGTTVWTVTANLSDNAHIQCILHTKEIDIGATLFQSMEGSAQDNITLQNSTFSLELEAQRPVGTWTVQYRQGAAVGLIRESAFHVGDATVFCILDNPGFNRAYAEFMHELAASAVVKNDQPVPTYMALHLVKHHGTAVGYRYASVIEIPGFGFRWHTYSPTFSAGPSLLGTDEGSNSSTNTDGGTVFSNTFRQENAVVVSKYTLTRKTPNRYDYEVIRKDITERGSLTGSLTGHIIRARELREWVAGRTTKPAVTELALDPPRIVPVNFSKSGNVLSVSNESGAVKRCELNDQGICANEAIEQSGFEAILVASAGAMPQMGVTKK
jgi:hypothetical protein